MPDAVLFGSRRYRRHRYGRDHPLNAPRVATTIALIERYGALSDGEYCESRPAQVEELCRFHTCDYVEALRRSEAAGRVDDGDRARHRIGTLENPFFPGVFTVPALATGGSIDGARAVLTGRVAFNPAGGMHHARPDQAHGFCYFNDVVLAIQELRAAGLRVLYIDIDAHHGDAVEAAVADDAGVTYLSLHMDTAYAYPFAGGRSAGNGGGRIVNVPLPQHVHDREYRLVWEAVGLPLLAAAGADAVVLQAGADILAPDPLGKFEITTQCFLSVVADVLRHAPRRSHGRPALLVVGGGGYHPIAVARCWTGVWAVLSGRELPEALPAGGAEVLRALEWDLDEDEPYYAHLFRSRFDVETDRPVRREIIDLVRAVSRHPLLRGVA